MANYYTIFSTMLKGTPYEWEWLESLIKEKLEDEDTEWEYYDIDFKLESNGIWMYGEYGFNEDVAEAISEYLDRFYPDEVVKVYYANTCSKPRIDSFGGGVVFITKDDLYWVDTVSIGLEDAKLLRKKWRSASGTDEE